MSGHCIITGTMGVEEETYCRLMAEQHGIVRSWAKLKDIGDEKYVSEFYNNGDEEKYLYVSKGTMTDPVIPEQTPIPVHQESYIKEKTPTQPVDDAPSLSCVPESVVSINRQNMTAEVKYCDSARSSSLPLSTLVSINPKALANYFAQHPTK